MKFELNINWKWVLQKVRIIFLLGVFYLLFEYVAPVLAFLWILYFILNDLSEIYEEIENNQEEVKQLWTRSWNHKRNNF